MPNIGMFGFRALWSPYFFLFIVAVMVLYFYAATKKRSWFSGSEPLKKKEGIFFVSALMLIYILKGSPIDLLSHLMFTFHMIQMAFLLLLAPQFLIIGIPVWMWEKILSLPVIRPIFRLLTKPILALILFNGTFSFYHVPAIFDTVKSDPFLHAVYTTMLFIFALGLWWPIYHKLGEEKPLQGLLRFGYLLAASALLTPACALIIFNGQPMYATYASAELWVKSLALCVPVDVLGNLNLSNPQLFNPLSLLYDQQLGGIIMKILQEFINGGVLYKIFIEWYRQENNNPDPILPGQ